MKSTLGRIRRLRVEGLESRMLLAACPADGGLELGLTETINQAASILTGQTEELVPAHTDTQVPSMAEAAMDHVRQVERPFKVKATTTAVVNLSDGSFEGAGEGVATHLGRFTWAAQGVYNLMTGEGVGGGVMTAANGDKIYFTFVGASELKLTGGDGRFENVSGGFTFLSTVVSQELDPASGTVAITYSWSGMGKIAY